MAKTSKPVEETTRKHPILLWISRLLSIAITLVVIASFVYVYMSAALPDVTALKDAELQVPLKIYTRDGQLLGQFGEARRTPLSLDQIPPQLINAVVATEDQRFFEHGGIDMYGLLRATGELLITGTKAQGGSTITMQVARNFYLSRQKTFGRKFNEILLALKIDRELSKRKILELYLNKIYLGKRAYGVAAASEVYYGKPLNELTLPELALIGGLPKAPSTINPIANPTAAKARRNHVLERMLSQGYIDQRAYQQAIAAPITAGYHAQPVAIPAPYVAEMVRNLMLTSFGDKSYTGGYQVYTTIDSHLQLAANQAIRDGLLNYDKRHSYRGAEQNLGAFKPNKLVEWRDTLEGFPNVNGLRATVVIDVAPRNLTVLLSSGEHITIPWSGLSWTKRKDAAAIAKVGDVVRIQATGNGWQLAQIPTAQAALIALNPNNGAINALVGGFDYETSSFNRVVQAERQSGSGFKPFLWAAALNKDFTLASLVDDEPLVFVSGGKVWRPQDDDHEFWGPTRLRVGLAWSRNLVSIRLLQALGLSYAIDYISKFGFNPSKLPNDLTLALGTGTVTPLELATGYAVFANTGYKITPFLINQVVDAQGKTIYQADPKVACTDCSDTMDAVTAAHYAPRVISPQVAYLVTSAMQSVIKEGTGAGARSLDRNDLAGKTGTTSDHVDAWFSGFNSDLVTSVWIGFDNPDSLHEYGAQAAVPIWTQFMRQALAGKPEHSMAEPTGITAVKIDPNTGLLAPAGAPNAVFEYFRDDTAPTQTAPPITNDNSATTDKAKAAAAAPIEDHSEPLF